VLLLTRGQPDMTNIPFFPASLSFNHLRRTVPSDLPDIQTMVYHGCVICKFPGKQHLPFNSS
jgi:hypothetical protein